MKSNVSTILLHIGYPKTGTSAIQWFLHANRDELYRHGVHYPRVGEHEGSHHKLAFALSDNPYERWTDAQRSILFTNLASEIDNSLCRIVVLSSELFLNRFELIQGCKEFMKIFQGRRLRIIVYLRRQDTFLESMYKQFVWDPHQRLSDGVSKFLENYGQAGDYHMALSGWASLVGKENILPVVYEQAQKEGGCIKRFCSLLDVDAGELGSGDVDERRNVSPGTLSTEVVRIANSFSDLDDQQRLEIARKAKTLDAIDRSMPIPRIFSSEQCAQIASRFHSSNRKLAEDFVGQPLDGFWFHERPEYSVRA